MLSKNTESNDGQHAPGSTAGRDNSIQVDIVSQNSIARPEGDLRTHLNHQFNLTFGDSHIDQLIDLFARLVWIKTNSPDVANRNYSDTQLIEFARDSIRSAFERQISQTCNVLDKFLLLMSDSFHYDPELNSRLTLSPQYYHAVVTSLSIIQGLLPDRIQQALSANMLVGSSVNRNGFALLFHDNRKDSRRIVTQNELIEIRDASGYKYLDLSPEGLPFTRCVTSRGGGRAFFDGVCLMSHPSFKTCAPKVSFFPGGYIVNSTGVTIINGRIYPLINETDMVAQTNGALPSKVLEFTEQQQFQSFEQNNVLANQINVDPDGVIHLAEKRIKPLGVFKPASKELLETGFTLYKWSEFCEL